MGRSRGAEVIVYHVIDLGDHWIKREYRGPVREMLERHRRTLDTFLREKFPEEMNLTEVRQVVEFGGPVDNIVEKAEGEPVEKIVMSTHGRTGIDHLLMGSVAEKVYRTGPVSGPDRAGTQEQSRKGGVIGGSHWA